MVLLLHIAVALSSIVFSAFTLFMPSKIKVRISQGLTAATLASGTYLVISMKTNMLRACMTGLVYLAVVSFMIVMANRKLAAEQQSTLEK